MWLEMLRLMHVYNEKPHIFGHSTKSFDEFAKKKIIFSSIEILPNNRNQIEFFFVSMVT